MRWITVTHTQRWHAYRHSSGTGPVYQGRFKSFPVQIDEHFITVARYVERNERRRPRIRESVDGARDRNTRPRGSAHDREGTGAGPRCGGVSHPPEADCQLGHQFAGLHTTERPLGCVTAAGERLPACVQKSLALRGATACSGSRKSFRSFCRRSQAQTEDGGGE